MPKEGIAIRLMVWWCYPNCLLLPFQSEVQNSRFLRIYKPCVSSALLKVKLQSFKSQFFCELCQYSASNASWCSVSYSISCKWIPHANINRLFAKRHLLLRTGLISLNGLLWIPLFMGASLNLNPLVQYVTQTSQVIMLRNALLYSVVGTLFLYIQKIQSVVFEIIGTIILVYLR